MLEISPHKILLLSKSGSQLFGTATPSSDLDVKGVFLPSRESLYLQQAPQQFSHNTNPSDSGIKNQAEDVDVTIWSVQFWLKLLLRGDINAVSLLFSPTHPEAVLEPTDAAFLQKLAELEPCKILTKDLGGMMGFAHSQAIKYSEKGRHLKALQIATEHLGAITGLVGAVAETIIGLVADNKLARSIEGGNGQKQLLILEKAFDYSARADWAVKPLLELQERYGKRAKQALQDGGVDYKAFSHSLRVLEEMRLLHLAGRITYPHEKEFAKLLREVKIGKLEYGRLLEVLDAKLLEVQEAEKHSVLPEKPDHAYVDGFVLSLYK
jgi:DNA-binding transcriptional ArsR family regulator